MDRTRKANFSFPLEGALLLHPNITLVCVTEQKSAIYEVLYCIVLDTISLMYVGTLLGNIAKDVNNFAYRAWYTKVIPLLAKCAIFKSFNENVQLA